MTDNIDPSRIFTALMNTGLQQKDNALYQVLRDLINVLIIISKQTGSIINIISGGGAAGPQGPPGPIGSIIQLEDLIFENDLVWFPPSISAPSQWITIGSDIYYLLGNVGIGTSTPAFNLDVAGTIRANTGIGGVALYIGNADAIRGNAGTAGVLYIDASGDLSGTINVRATIINLAGAVGVAGLTSNGDILVNGGNGVVQIAFSSPISFRLNSTSGGAKNWALETTRTAVAGTLEFTNLTDAINSPRMVILAGGNVGIGTVSPSDLLEVVGTVRAENISLPATGTAPTVGQVTLVGGTATVNTTAITATALLFLQQITPGGVVGFTSYTQVNGTSFTINSSSVADTSTYNWLIVETH